MHFPPVLYNIWQKLFVSQKLRPLLEHPSFFTGNSICELGCGPGTNFPSLSSKSYLGIDVDNDYIAHAQKKFGNKFTVGDLSKPLEPGIGRFDLVLLHSVLHHLNDDAVQVALNSAKNLLAPGGTLHVFDAILMPPYTLAGLLARADYGDCIRTWEQWRFFFDDAIPSYSKNNFNLNLLGLNAYFMFHLTWKSRS